MEFSTWLSFAMVSLVIVITPGVTIAYIVSQSLAHGKKAALPLSVGVVCGDTACFLASVVGIGAILITYPSLASVVKYAGAGYLIYLGISGLLAKGDNSQIGAANDSFNGKALFKRSFFITFLNPKGILFFGAFFPQFIDNDLSLLFQTSLLGFTFVSLALFSTLSYSLACAGIQSWAGMDKFRANFHYVSGVMLIGLGVFTVAN